MSHMKSLTWLWIVTSSSYKHFLPSFLVNIANDSGTFKMASMSKRHGRMLEVNGTNDSLVPFSFLQFRLTNLVSNFDKVRPVYAYGRKNTNGLTLKTGLLVLLKIPSSGASSKSEQTRSELVWAQFLRISHCCIKPYKITLHSNAIVWGHSEVWLPFSHDNKSLSLSLFLQTAPKKGTTFQGPFVIFIDYNAAFELTILGCIPWQNVSAVLLFNY